MRPRKNCRFIRAGLARAWRANRWVAAWSIDFSRYMRRIFRTDNESVRIQPGVVLGTVERKFRGRGRVFGPDPANRNVTTMGSVIALDASGSYWRKYGSARRHVESLQVVLADGTIMEVGRETLPHSRFGLANGESAGSNGHTDHVTEGSTNETESAPENTLELRRSELAQNLANIIAPNKELICQYSPKSLVNRCGYQLNDVLSDGEIDLARLLCGSEGTLALDHRGNGVDPNIAALSWHRVIVFRSP